MNASIFKAYDVRGLYPEQINGEIVGKIAVAVAKKLKCKKIIVGYDARLSSPTLHQAVMKALNSYEVVDAGMITTPMLYFLVTKLKADGGIMITASHNPKEYNGIKAVGKKAAPISGTEIEKLVSRFQKLWTT